MLAVPHGQLLHDPDREGAVTADNEMIATGRHGGVGGHGAILVKTDDDGADGTPQLPALAGLSEGV